MKEILVRCGSLTKRIYNLTDNQKKRLETIDTDDFLNVINYQLKDKPIYAKEVDFGVFDTDCSLCLYENRSDSGEIISQESLGMCVDLALDLICGSNVISKLFSSRTLSQIIHLADEHEYRKLVDILRSHRKSVPEGKENWNMGQIIERYDRLARDQEEDDEGYEWEPEEFKKMVYQPKELQSLSELMLVPEVKEAIQTFREMYEKRDELKKAALPTCNRILLAGPPGNGKTALAKAIAKELEMPMYFFDASKVRGGRIGEMGNNIWTVFHGIQKVAKDGKVILFIDECDSMATKRIYTYGADKEDSAALNAILMHLDQLNDNTIVIAATNYPEELDPAFARRFNPHLYLAPPTAEDITQYVLDYQKNKKIKFTSKEMMNVPMDVPWSKVKEYCQEIHSIRILGTKIRIRKGWIGRNDKKHPTVGFRL